MLDSKTVLGVDISQSTINLALLRDSADGVELVKAASCPVPNGAIKDGNIEDSVLISKAIKALKSRSKIRARRAAVSLFSQPVLMQLIDMPKTLPSNIGRFIQNEVKRCVALSGKEIALDFCSIGSSLQPGAGRIFVLATDAENVAEIGRVCNSAGLNVEALEPPMLAYVRAFYPKKIAGRFDCNVLMVIIQDKILTLAVFRKQSLDFIRSKEIDREITGPRKLCCWLADQINAVIKFYDVEVSDSSPQWEVTIVADCPQLPEGVEESLKAKVDCSELIFRTPQNAFQDTFINQNVGSDRPSVVAVGLGMRFLGTDGINLGVNLLPPESAEVKSFKKHVLITANIIAALLMMMIFISGALNIMANKVNENIARIKRTKFVDDTRSLFREEALADKQIVSLSQRIEQMNKVLESRHSLPWHEFLNDLRAATPNNVRILELFSKANSKISLKGLASSYEAVHLFVKMLNNSEYIDSASLIETERKRDLVSYEINFSLVMKNES
jgi:Tfp pilus assembly protein PilN